MAARSASPKKAGSKGDIKSPGTTRGGSTMRGGKKKEVVVEKPKPPPLPTVSGLTPEMVMELKERFDQSVAQAQAAATAAAAASLAVVQQAAAQVIAAQQAAAAYNAQVTADANKAAAAAMTAAEQTGADRDAMAAAGKAAADAVRAAAAPPPPVPPMPQAPPPAVLPPPTGPGGAPYISVAQFAAILQSIGSNVTPNDPYVLQLIREAVGGGGGGMALPTASSAAAAAAGGSGAMSPQAAAAAARMARGGVDDPLGGWIDFTEYLSAIARHLIAQFATYEAELIRGFELLDVTRSGVVSANACRNAWFHAMGAGERLTSGLPTLPRTADMKAEVEAFIVSADPKKTDRIDYVKFVKHMITKINEVKKKKKKLKKKKEAPRYGAGLFGATVKK